MSNRFKNRYNRLNPTVPKRGLFFIAGSVWTFAGSLLLIKGFPLTSALMWERFIGIISAIATGILFYFFVFKYIVNKHINRLHTITSDYPSVFSFFNRNSYLIMALMISMGIMLRKTNILSHAAMTWLYISMALPLLVSAYRFFREGILYKSNNWNRTQDSTEQS